MLRASDFPPNKKNQTAQAFRKFREKGGRSLLVPIPDWERMMMVREFHAQHRHDPGFADWFQRAKLLSTCCRSCSCCASICSAAACAPARLPRPRRRSRPHPSRRSRAHAEQATALPMAGPHAADWTGWGNAPAASADPKEDIPLSLLLDEAGDGASSILAGRALRSNKSITLNKDVLKRHAAVLGGSGSGKTTLALCIIEQLLLRGTPAVLIDRKGDLCSYANPDVWRALEGEYGERRGEREKLADSIDVAVYTPGPRVGPSDLDHAAAQRHQRAARAGAAAARQPVGGGARRHAASEELGHPPEAVGHALRGAAHPRRPLQQGGDARRPDRACWRTRTPS